MNGYLTEDGTYYEVDKGVGHHYKFLRDILKLSSEELEKAELNWVVIRWWNCDEDTVIPFIKYRAKTNAFSYTERPKYTLAQLEWLQKHNVFIDKTKI